MAADKLKRRLDRQRLHVKHHRPESARLGHGNAVFDFFLARGSDQDLNIARTSWRRPDDLKVQIDLVERKRNVLIGLGLDVELHFLLAQPIRKHDFLGNDGRSRQRHRDVLHPGTKTSNKSPDAFGDGVQIGDVPVDHRVARKGFDCVPLHADASLLTFSEFHHLHR